MNTPLALHTAPATVNIETPDPGDLWLVFALHPPEPASAKDRVAGSLSINAPPIKPNILVPSPSQGLRVVTGLSHIGADSDDDQESPGLPSPDPSSPGLRTPMDSPPVARVLPKGKDDVPDIRHLLIKDRAPAASQGGPSEGATDAVIGAKPPQDVSSTEQLKHQLYHLVIELLDDEDNYDLTTGHRLYIDTGSQDTFGFGEGVQRIVNDTEDMDTEKREPWTLAKMRANPKHTRIKLGLDLGLTTREMRRQGFTLGRMGYKDGARAHLVLQERRSFVLRSYDWKQKKAHPMFLFWRFGVAFAVDDKFWADPTSGMLGLGPAGIQHAYKPYSAGTVTPPSFLAALYDHLNPISRPGEEIAIFFCLRLAPQCYEDGLPGLYPIQSWMSFNVWPCQPHQPEWNSRKIIVCNSRPHDRRWTVYLRSIRFAVVDSSKPNAQTRPVPLEDVDGYLEDTTLQFVDSKRTRGLVVHLDTGASVSYLPLDAVRKMNEKLFKGIGDVADPGDRGVGSETYILNPKSWLFKPKWKVQVVYEFEGEGDTPVFVSGPLETFAYQRHPDYPDKPEGLVFPNSSSNIKSGTLGLNFFQSMYISLHKSTDGLDFVRMAGQWPEQLANDLKNYYVSGVSSV